MGQLEFHESISHVEDAVYDDLTLRQSAMIRRLVQAAEEHRIPLWLENGWAIDARLGRVIRPHGDIDVVYPRERQQDYELLLHELGFKRREETDYGFLIWNGDILIDTEACDRYGDEYGFPGYPPGSCPLDQQGTVAGCPVRCVSWEAMYVEFLGYLAEIPREKWRPQDFESLRIVEEHLSVSQMEWLRRSFPPSNSAPQS